MGIKNEILNMKVSLEIFLSTAAAYNLDFRSVGLGVMYTPNTKKKNLNIPFHLNRLQYSVRPNFGIGIGFGIGAEIFFTETDFFKKFQKISCISAS